MDQERCAAVRKQKEKSDDNYIPGAHRMLFDTCDADVVRHYLNKKEHTPANSDTSWCVFSNITHTRVHLSDFALYKEYVHMYVHVHWI